MPLFKGKKDKKIAPPVVRADFILSTRIPSANRRDFVADETHEVDEYPCSESPGDGTFVRPDFRSNKRTQQAKKTRVSCGGGTSPSLSATLRSDGSASSHGSSRGSTLSDDRILSRSFPTSESVSVIDNYSEPADQCSHSNSRTSLKSLPSPGSGDVNPYSEPYHGSNTSLGNEMDEVGDNSTTSRTPLVRPDYISIPGKPCDYTPESTIKSEYTEIPESTGSFQGQPVDLRPCEEYEDPWELTSRLAKLHIISPPEPQKSRSKVITVDEPLSSNSSKSSLQQTFSNMFPRQQSQSELEPPAEYEPPWDFQKATESVKSEWRKSQDFDNVNDSEKGEWRKSYNEDEILRMTEVPGLKHVDYAKKFPRNKKSGKKMAQSLDSLDKLSSTSGSHESIDSTNISCVPTNEEIRVPKRTPPPVPVRAEFSTDSSHIVHKPIVQSHESKVPSPSHTAPSPSHNATKVDKEVKDINFNQSNQKREMSCQTDESIESILDDYKSPDLSRKQPDAEVRQKPGYIMTDNKSIEAESFISSHKVWLPEDQNLDIFADKLTYSDKQTGKGPVPCSVPNNDSGVGLDYEPPWDLNKQQQSLQEQAKLHDTKKQKHTSCVKELVEIRPPREKVVNIPPRQSVAVTVDTDDKTGLSRNRGSSKNRKSYKFAVNGNETKKYEFYDESNDALKQNKLESNEGDTLPISLNQRHKQIQGSEDKISNTGSELIDDNSDDEICPYSVTLGNNVIAPVSRSSSSDGDENKSRSKYKIPVTIPVQPVSKPQTLDKRPPQPTPRESVIKETMKTNIPSDVRPLEDYDDPWDKKPHNQYIGQGRKSSQPKVVPFEDERPPEEYEAPWDHKKQSILMAAEVDSDGYEKPVSSSTRSILQQQWSGGSATNTSSRSHSSLSNTSHRSSRHRHSDQRPPVGEPVEAKVPLHKQEWYHSAISRYDAESLLRVHREGSYLVRNSESSKDSFSLSLKSTVGFIHMKIQKRLGDYILGEFSQPFATIPEMIHYYTINKLPIKGAEHMVLVHPVICDMV